MTYNKQVYNRKVVILKNSYMNIHSAIVLLFIQYHINVLTLKSFTLLDYSTQILYIYTIYLIVYCLSLMIEICKLQHFVSEKVVNE